MPIIRVENYNSGEQRIKNSLSKQQRRGKVNSLRMSQMAYEKEHNKTFLKKKSIVEIFNELCINKHGGNV